MTLNLTLVYSKTCIKIEIITKCYFKTLVLLLVCHIMSSSYRPKSLRHYPDFMIKKTPKVYLYFSSSLWYFPHHCGIFSLIFPFSYSCRLYLFKSSFLLFFPHRVKRANTGGNRSTVWVCLFWIIFLFGPIYRI